MIERAGLHRAGCNPEFILRGPDGYHLVIQHS